MVEATEPIAQKLREIERGQRPVPFSHVIESAQGFLVAVLARKLDKTIWVLCPNVRSQELLYESLLNWHPNAQFLPEAEFAAVENILPDPEIAAERLALLISLERERGPHLIVATRASLQNGAPKPGTLQSAVVQLRRGTEQKIDSLLEKLSSAGYERATQITTRGQFAVRGGIVDLYSWQAPLPARLEFFGDQIESLREFDIDTQTSVHDLNKVDILLAQGTEVSSPPARSENRPSSLEIQTGRVQDYIASDHLTIDIEPDSRANLTGLTGQVCISEGSIEEGPEDFSGSFQDCDVGEFAVGEFVLLETKRAQFVSRLKEWRASQAKIVIYFQTEGEIERFREILGAVARGGDPSGAGLPNTGTPESTPPTTLDDIDLVEGTLARGFCFPAANLVVLSAAELFGRFAAHPRRRLHRAERHRAQIDFSELHEGDYVVHLEHGIAKFCGLQRFVVGQAPRLPGGEETATVSEAVTTKASEALALEFADEAKLYVPLEQAYLVSRYVGVGKKSPPLSSLGDAKWARAKKNAVASIFDYAGKMLALQAERETQLGHAFGPDTKWQARIRAFLSLSAKRRTS